MKLAAFLIPLTLTGNAYSQNIETSITVRSKIRIDSVDNGYVECAYQYSEKEGGLYVITGNTYEVGLDHRRFTMADIDDDSLVDHVDVDGLTNIGTVSKYELDHMSPELTTKHREALAEYQDEFDRYLSMFGPECGR